ncbi:hypothetical protein LJB78_00775 [Bacteroidales bacterium OttesenSCG-928-J16]|nr:hypothetical protein [Bacteroidales bacterium OttesenSCG-928-J16]
MKKLFCGLFFIALCYMKPYAQYNDFAGAYVYSSAKKASLKFELFSDGKYFLYLYRTNVHSSSDELESHERDNCLLQDNMIEIEYDMFVGDYLIADSLLICYLDNNPAFAFQLIDSLNMKIIHSRKKIMQNNDFIYREASYFLSDSIVIKGDPFGDGYYSKWHIYNNGNGIYECYYRYSPKTTLILFDYDYLEYLSDKIYKQRKI